MICRRRYRHADRREPIATRSASMAKARRSHQSELRTRLTDPFLIAAEACRRRRHKKVVAATPERERGSSSGRYRKSLEPAGHRARGGREASGPPLISTCRETELATSNPRWMPRTTTSAASAGGVPSEVVTPSLSGRRALLKSIVTVPGCRSRRGGMASSDASFGRWRRRRFRRCHQRRREGDR